MTNKKKEKHRRDYINDTELFLFNKLEREELIQEINETEKENRKKRYNDYLQSVINLSPFEKAEAYLNYRAKCLYLFSDLEALVYLKSRNKDCKSLIKKTSEWLEKAENAFQNNPGVLCRHFWTHFLKQRNYIDSTMLRVYDWCSITGFENHWQDVISQIKMANNCEWLYLVSMCRSEHAVNNARRELEYLLTGQEKNATFVWGINLVTKDTLKLAISTIIGNYTLRGKNNINVDMVKQANRIVYKTYSREGYWNVIPFTDDDGTFPSIWMTALAVHALCLSQPKGYEDVVDKAVSWLWNMQGEFGGWRDIDFVNVTFLTVLVLDAIELANGGTQVTFKLDDNNPNMEEGSREEETTVKYIFKKNGTAWQIQFENNEPKTFTHLNGFKYIHSLLVNRNKNVSSFALRQLFAPTTDAKLLRLIDKPYSDNGGDVSISTTGHLSKDFIAYSYKELQESLDQLGYDLEKSEEEGNLETKDQILQEIESINNYIKSATGLCGRKREFPNPDKKAADAVRKSIKTAIEAIRNIIPEFAKHLDKHITTGSTCSYSSEINIPWLL